jgi:preprotein translocase subunit Sec63
MSGTALFVVVLLCAIGGYVVVSLLFDSGRKPARRHDPKTMAQEPDDPFDHARRVLGVESEVTPGELKMRYHELLVKYHPDKTQHLGEEFQRLAEEKTQQIVRAYELLNPS